MSDHLTDTELLDWLDADELRLKDVYWRRVNENQDLRTATRALIEMERQ